MESYKKLDKVISGCGTSWKVMTSYIKVGKVRNVTKRDKSDEMLRTVTNSSYCKAIQITKHGFDESTLLTRIGSTPSTIYI